MKEIYWCVEVDIAVAFVFAGPVFDESDALKTWRLKSIISEVNTKPHDK